MICCTEEIPVEISQGQRTRRSAYNSIHSQTYDLDLKVEGSQVQFHLVRNDDIKTNVPTLSLAQGKLTHISLKEQKVDFCFKNWGFHFCCNELHRRKHGFYT